jgi:hypothetical protein
MTKAIVGEIKVCNDTRCEDVRVTTSSLYGRWFYSALAVLFLALFVLNACTHGTTLGLISAGGLALLMGYLAYRAWPRKRQANRP